jgi:hypothetical protein
MFSFAFEEYTLSFTIRENKIIDWDLWTGRPGNWSCAQVLIRKLISVITIQCYRNMGVSPRCVVMAHPSCMSMCMVTKTFVKWALTYSGQGRQKQYEYRELGERWNKIIWRKRSTKEKSNGNPCKYENTKNMMIIIMMAWWSITQACDDSAV